MKFKFKLFCLLLVVSSAVINASPYLVENYNATVNVTFRVDMSAEDTHADGVYLAGGSFDQQGHLMTDDGNDVWSVTLSLEGNQTYQYKFRNQPSFGTWDGFEDQTGLIAGSCGTGSYNDRYIEVLASDIVLPVVSYGSCTRDVAPVSGCMDSNATNYNVDATIDNGSCSYSGPDSSAPTPTVDASKVISIYSDTYTSIYTDLSGSWSDSEHEEIQIGSDHVVKFIPAGGGHQKASIDISATDCSGREYLHLDYFATNSSTKLKFNFHSNGDTNFWEVATHGGGVVAGSWQSIDIPLSHFTNDLSNVEWLRIEALSPADIVYMDNVYFYGGTVVNIPGCTDGAATNYNADATEDDGSCVTIPSAPVPTEAAEDVLSIFSNAYTNVEGTDFNPNWGQSTVVSVGDEISYSNLNYQGTQFAAQDVSAYGYLHVDFYTTNSTALSMYLISPGAEAGHALEITTGEWNSVDIPLTTYSGVVDLTRAFQFKVVGNGDVVFDNLYFGGAAPAPVLGCTDSAAENYNADASQDDSSCTYVSTAYCSTQVTHLDIEAETPSAILLSIENVDANTVEVSATSANNDPIDLLIVGAQSNPVAGVSETSIVDGTATLTLTWNDGAPAVASFEVLWSKESTGGNWMLNRDQLSAINTTDACPEGPAVIPGCTDATRCNYNSAATNDDGTCLPALDGICESCSLDAEGNPLTDGTGTIVDNDTDDDGVCDADEVKGCTDDTRCNYNSAATNDADCLRALDGICESCSLDAEANSLTDGTGTIVDNDTDDDNVCDADEVEGCTDDTRCNYNSAATDDADCLRALDGICESCSLDAEGNPLTDGTGTIVDNDADDDGVCDADEVRIVEFTDVKMEIYPNPARDQLHLIINDNFNRLNIEVVNLPGIRLIDKEMKNITSGSVIKFDIDHLPKGVYVLKISTNGEMVTTIPWVKQ